MGENQAAQPVDPFVLLLDLRFQLVPDLLAGGQVGLSLGGLGGGLSLSSRRFGCGPGCGPRCSRGEQPAALHPVVWGTETSMTAEASPLRTPPVRRDDGELRRFTWITTTPALHARYCLERGFRAGPEHVTDQEEFM
ncbi:hypothetical protein [Streptomyces sp. PA5.6]|uniref:hypothetical protein n=1 Tax=Streptomyces sp. PA5.6 TaxID=3035651 RepID=UPI003904C6C6